MLSNMRKFALAGNPNSGKTTLFNSLTGATAHVGNWPGVTVDKREGSYRKLGEPIYIVDLPGIYSLSPYTPEEVISRNYILEEKPDCVINIVDATNLERNLYLTTQLLEIDVPVVVALNMSDVVRKNGDKIDAQSLSEKLGVPVVEISALKQENLDVLMQEAVKAANKERKGSTIIGDKDLLHLINDVQIALELKGIENPLFHAVKLVELDELETAMHPDLVETVNKFKATFKNETFGSDFEALIADERYDYIAKNYATTLTKAPKQKGEKGEEKLTKSDKIDKVMTHRIWALPLFAVIMFFIFHVTFSEDILFLNRIFGVEVSGKLPINALTGMGYEDMVAENVDLGIEYLSYEDDYVATIADPEASDKDKEEAQEGLEVVAEIKAQAAIDGIDLSDDEAVEEWKGDLVERYDDEQFSFVEAPVLEGVPSIGVWLQSWFGYGTGSLIGLAESGFEAGGVRDTWYAGLICDGVLTGLDAVLSFVPQIMILFLFIAILEDSGYMARVAFILDRAFRKFGLSGKAFIPMLTGFGCSVPAIMATRTLEDEREKNRTIRLMTCFSCGAKAPIWALLAAVGAMAGFAGDIFVFSIYLGGIACAVIFALFMKLFSKDQYVSPFIMELPQYHLPQARNVFAHLWEKLKHYVIKAGTIIAACTIVIWFLSNFGWAFWQGIVPIEDSILASLGRVLRFFFYPLGCLEGGWTHGEDGWKYVVSTLTGLIAKEDVVATMAELGLTEATINLSIAGVYSFAVYNLFTLPCFAAIGAAHGEQKGKEFWLTLLWWFAMSYGVALVVYWLGTLFSVAWWGGLLVLLALGGVITYAGIVVSKRHKVALAAE